jgi:putative membrane protein
MATAGSGTTTIQQYPLERRKITKKVLVAMIGFSILFAVLLAAAAFIAASGVGWVKTIFWILFALYFVVFALEIWYQTMYYKKYFYNLEPDFMVIKKGVIMPHETMLPYEKLQDVYMDQDLFDRLLSLWDVHVSTATAMSGYEAHIDGVNHENADALRNIILDKIRKKGA